MNKVQKYNSFNTNTPSSESYRNTNIDKKASNKWMDQGELSRETDAYMVAIQGGVIPTRNYQ
jgi:hypothetical protein